MSDLSGLVVVVTGGNSGIGLGMAEAMADAGADIVVWGRNEEKNAAAVERLAATGRRVAAFGCDVGEEDQVVDAFAKSVEAMGQVDSMFANAGTARLGNFWEIEMRHWRRVTAVNLDGVMTCFRETARHLIDRGAGGSLVAVSSTAAIHGPGNNAAYAATKAGVLGLVRSAAVGLARHGIRANALTPGWTITEMSGPSYAHDKFREVTTGRTPAGRWADPSEMGAAAVYLADPKLTFHTGDNLVVDGGYTIF